MAVIVVSSEIVAPIADAFAFHLDPRGAARIAPRGQRVSAVEGPAPLKEGDVVTIRVRQWPSPVAQTWRVTVERIDAPFLLVDRATDSPFRSWCHEHRFAESAPGRTRMTDRIDYELPFGLLGRLADRLVVARIMRAAFRDRHRRTRRLLER
jgi:ligand-binding SRPBCC domain-containing protein